MGAIETYWARCEGALVHGVNDCCMTVADTILAAGGPDLMAEYRGRYTTRIGFVRAFRKRGHATLEEAIAAAFDAHGERVAFARDFDVGIASYLAYGRPAVSPAFHQDGFWMLRSEHGLFASMGNPRTIWRVVDA